MCREILRQRTVDLDDVLGHVHELVDEALAVHLSEDPALVVIAQGAAHGLVVHVWLVLVQAPESRHRLRVDQLEHALLAVRPLDEARAVLAVLQQLQQELPQVRGGALPALALDARRGRCIGARPFLRLQFVVMMVALVVAEVEYGVWQLVVRQRRGRRRCEVVSPASPAAVTISICVTIAQRSHWWSRMCSGVLQCGSDLMMLVEGQEGGVEGRRRGRLKPRLQVLSGSCSGRGRLHVRYPAVRWRRWEGACVGRRIQGMVPDRG